MPVKDLAQAVMRLWMSTYAHPGKWGIQAFFPMAPVVDGDILPHAPLDPIAKGIHEIDIMVGHTMEEAALFSGMLPWLKADPQLFPTMLAFPEVGLYTLAN